jgi:two-component system, NarL family, response regulator NreC
MITNIFMEKIKILIADIHPAFREGLSRLFNDEEDLLVVATVEDGEKAVHLAREHQPDVAIIDIFIPKIDSVEAVRQIKVHSPLTRILMIGAHTYESYIIATVKVGASGYILKTAPIAEMVNAVRLLHHGGCVFYENALSKIAQNLSSDGEAGKSRPRILHHRELQVLKLAGKGFGNKEIADHLNISVHTVQSHLSRVFTKLSVHSRTEAVNTALQKGLFSIRDLN